LIVVEVKGIIDRHLQRQVHVIAGLDQIGEIDDGLRSIAKHEYDGVFLPIPVSRTWIGAFTQADHTPPVCENMISPN
jgi:hypothetical protein